MWQKEHTMTNLNQEETTITPNIKPHTQVGLDRFYEELKAQYTYLFVHSQDYRAVALATTPELLARKMTLGLANGSANKEGAGIKSTCQVLGIPYTYKAIRAYLNGE